MRLLGNKICVWLAETFLLQSEVDFADQLTLLNRTGTDVFIAKTGKRWVSSLAKGMYQKPNHFLLASGINSDLPLVKLNEQQYVGKLWSGLHSFGVDKLKQILKSQCYPSKLQNVFSLPSIGLGIAGAFFALWTIQLGYLHVKSAWVEQKATQIDVSEIVKMRRTVETKSEAINALSQLSQSKRSTTSVWLILSRIMENDIEVLRVEMKGNVLIVRMQARTETEAIELAKSLPWVENAEFSSAVYDSRGKKRFNISMTLKDTSEELVING
jgi:hypothetical protein